MLRSLAARLAIAAGALCLDVATRLVRPQVDLRRRLDQARALRDEGEDLIAQAERREAEALERIAQERAEALRVAEETRQRIEQTSAEVTLSTMFVLRALPRSARVSQ